MRKSTSDADYLQGNQDSMGGKAAAQGAMLRNSAQKPILKNSGSS